MKQRQIESALAPTKVSTTDDPKLRQMADKAEKLSLSNFLSAEKLGISTQARDALIKTLEMFEAGMFRHAYHRTMDPSKYPFHMNTWGGRHACGSVCCIGGTAEWVGNFQFNNCPLQMNRLFFPYHISNWGRLTPEMAGIALRTYLETGKEDWLGAIKQVNGGNK